MCHRLTLVISALLLSGLAFAQPVPPPPRGDAPPRPADATPAAIDGTVKQFLLAPRGEVEGLLLNDGTQVAVPPHLRDALSSTVRAGDAVHVDGRRESATRVAAAAIADRSNGKSVVDAGPPASPPPPPDVAEPVAMSAKGAITVLLTGRRGEVNGAVLDDGSILRFAPRRAAYDAAKFAVGQRLAVSGMGEQNQFGRVIDVQSLQAE